jgi:hypothetical protein
MLSDADIYHAAHLMLHQYGDDAELEAAQCDDTPCCIPATLTWLGDRESISASADEDWFVVDSPLEGAVWSEPVSGYRSNSGRF